MASVHDCIYVNTPILLFRPLRSNALLFKSTVKITRCIYKTEKYSSTTEVKTVYAEV